ncbi:MAG: glycosyltransferase family 39 protein [Sandaracinaceae bacterium]|nr:glycosyltransferase family 39 protein [Sandaracinaceae bacterium]
MRAPEPPSKGFAFVLFLLVWALVALTTGRYHVRGDASQMCNAAASITDHGWIDVPTGRDDRYLGPDGLYYTKYPLGNTIQCGPGLALQSLGRELGGDESSTQFFLAGIVPALWTALLALGFFSLARELRFSRPVAAFGALFLVFSSPIWAYGREMYSENPQGLALIWTLWAYVRAMRLGTRRHFLLGGILVGACIHCKTPLAVIGLASFVFVFLSRPDRQKTLRFFLYGALGFAPMLALWLGYNYVRYGQLLELGYASGRDLTLGFATPLYSGLHGLLLSPGKSIFVYAPLLLLLPFGLVRMWRRHRALLVYAAIPVVFLFVTMGMWWSGLGDWGWGPRLVVPTYPLLFLGLLYVLERKGWRWKTAIVSLAALGIVVNFLGIIIDHSHYIGVTGITQGGLQIHRLQNLVRDDLVIVHFVPEFSPPIGHGWLLDRYLSGAEWTDESWYPWRTIGIPAWQPHSEPAPRVLNHWSDGSAMAWTILGVGYTIVALLFAGLLYGMRWRPRPPPPQS